MRTTVQFDTDIARAVDQLRRERGLGVSEAVNELIRRGLLRREPVEPFRQPTRPVGLKIDVSNVVEVLDLLEGDDSR
ncbi:MAG: ribbon-helix-helix protein, CopG family [Actinomycetota bacterium]|nr:ribbon-helix-helix protein, CopG family [Actinomycetota bacterium]